MVLFVFRKLILHTCMGSHPVGLDVWFLVGPFVYFHIWCVRTVKALARLGECAGSPEPLLVVYVISTIISWAGSYVLRVWRITYGPFTHVHCSFVYECTCSLCTIRVMVFRRIFFSQSWCSFQWTWGKLGSCYFFSGLDERKRKRHQLRSNLSLVKLV